jgi:putative salt-induced outer membrane protein YdiY
MEKRILRGCVLALLMALTGPALADRANTDVVYLTNGDRVTGEIKSLDYASLKIETPNMGTISIEWPAVRSVASSQSFTVEDRDGGQYTGLLTGSDENQMGMSLVTGDTVTVPLAEVVRMSQIETGFWNRINGSLAVGLNYTKAGDTSVFNVNFTATYRSPRIESTLTVGANSTTTNEGTTDRDQIANSLRLARPGRKYWNFLSSWDRNEELGIDSRIQLGAGFGRHLLQTKHTALDGTLGLSFNNEWVNGQPGAQQSAEGIINGEWHVFRFSEPETSLVSTLSLFPSLTESGRWRSEFNITLSRDIYKDFTLDLSYYNSYDSDPPDAEASNKDYGFVTSISYKF